MTQGRLTLNLVGSIAGVSQARRRSAALVSAVPGALDEGGGWAVVRTVDARGVSPAIGSAVHGPGCLCCAPGDPVAGALTALFQDWARQKGARFAEVVLLEEGGRLAARASALRAHVLVGARFHVRIASEAE